MFVRIAPMIEMQGLETLEVSERRIRFRAGASAVTLRDADLGFVVRGEATLVSRDGQWVVLYNVTPNFLHRAWIYPALAITAVVWLATELPARIVLIGPLPALSLAAMGHRGSMGRRVRRLFSEAIDALPGLDC